MTPEEELELIEIEMEQRRRAQAKPPAPTPAAPVKPRPASTTPVADAGKGFAAGASRWSTLGFDDQIGGALTALGEVVSPTSTSDEGDDWLTRLQKGYEQGKADRRATVDEAYEKSPKAYTAGAVLGLAPTIALAPESVAARRALAFAGGVGMSDADLLSLDAAARGSLGLVGGEVANKVIGKVAPAVAPLLAKGVEAVKGAGTRAADAGRTGAAKGADALKVLLKKADDAPVARAAAGLASGGSTEGALLTARGAEKLLRKVGTKPAAPAPAAPVIPPAATTPLDDAAMAGLPPAATTAPVAPVDALDDLVATRMPAPAPTPAAAPAPAASQALPEQMTSVVPVVTRNSSAGNIAKAVEAKAIELGTTDLATIANALKLPTTLVSDPLKNAVSRFAFREAVKGAGSKAPAVVDDVGAALDDIAAEGQQMPMEALAAIRQAKIETPRSLLPGDRPMAQVAAANQGAEMRAAYNALDEGQRVAWIANLRRQGLDDEKIRTMLGITKAKWRQTSFNR